MPARRVTERSGTVAGARLRGLPVFNKRRWILIDGESSLLHLANDSVGAEIELPGAHFEHFWGQGRKILKLRLLGVIWCTSGGKEGKCSHGALEAKGVG